MPHAAFVVAKERYHQQACVRQRPETITYVINGRHFDFKPEHYTRPLHGHSTACPIMLTSALNVSNKHGPLFLAGQVWLRRVFTVFHKGTTTRTPITQRDETATIQLAEHNPAYGPSLAEMEARALLQEGQGLSLRESIRRIASP
ncbi:Pepsin A-1 [Durusdinium trenchii]|uniref:Pepsin A-1 n=1 Tax=Durusdinium trenchii TaxID=1381693 RepID=A0ABP0M150_9DINO